MSCVVLKLFSVESYIFGFGAHSPHPARKILYKSCGCGSKFCNVIFSSPIVFSIGRKRGDGGNSVSTFEKCVKQASTLKHHHHSSVVTLCRFSSRETTNWGKSLTLHFSATYCTWNSKRSVFVKSQSRITWNEVPVNKKGIYWLIALLPFHFSWKSLIFWSVALNTHFFDDNGL